MERNCAGSPFVLGVLPPAICFCGNRFWGCKREFFGVQWGGGGDPSPQLQRPSSTKADKIFGDDWYIINKHCKTLLDRTESDLCKINNFQIHTGR